MSEEMIVQDAVDVSSVDSGNSVDSTSGDQLQQNMEDSFFYDDGVDAIVNANGMTQYDKNNNPIRTMEDFNKMKSSTTTDDNQQSKQQQTQNGKTQSQTSTEKLATGFDSVFTKDGNLDVTKLIDTSSKFKDNVYQMRSTYKSSENGQGQTVDPKERMRTTVDSYRQQLEGERLEPIKEAYSGIVQAYQRAGVELPREVYEEFDKVFRDRSQKLETEINSKRESLIEEMLNEKTSASEMKEFERESSKNFKSIANELIPHVPESQREEKLSELIFGFNGEDGKFVPGYGADLISALFDSAMDGKTFQSPDDWKQAYNNWWYKYSSDPKNVSLIARLAFQGYVANNHGKYRDEWRKVWDKEQLTKKQNSNQQSRSDGAIGGNQSVSDALIDYHRTPARNLG